jgi:hypothetical protein
MHRESAGLDRIGSGVTERDRDGDTYSGGDACRRLITKAHRRADAGAGLDEARACRR